MATGDIIARTINADGISATLRVENLASGGSYLYDSANSQLSDTSTAKVVFTVVSKSFDATGAASTITRTVYGTATRRTPGSSSLSETSAGSDLDIVVALSEPIYAKDESGGGNSGTDVTVTVLANWYTKSGTPTNAATAVSVTNDSALAYYVPFGQWDILPYDRVSSNFRVAFTARHLHGIKCVKFTATGATSSHSETATVTTETKRLRSVSGLYGTCHETTIPISGFTQDETINLKAEVFPNVGDTELDTDDMSAEYVVTGRAPITVTCDKGDTLRAYAVVNASTGNDGTGVVSTTLSTAEANKYATIKAAIDANATQVYLEGSTHAFASRSTSKSTAYWIVIEPHPNEGGAVAVEIASGFPTLAVVKCKFKNVTLKSTATTSILNGSSTNFLCADTCTFDANTYTLAEHHYNFLGIYYWNCTFAESRKFTLNRTAGDTVRFSFDGCSLTNDTTVHTMNCIWRMMACVLNGNHAFQTLKTVGTQPYNGLYESNLARSVGGTWFVGWTNAASEYSFSNNVLEGIGMAPTNLFSGAEDAITPIDHYLFSHNTIVGERANVFYNDSGTTAMYSRGVRIIGNIFGKSFNTKHDLFGSASANRVGRWWVNYSTSKRSNLQGDNTSASFPGDYGGLRWTYSASFAFTDDKSGAGAGGGDYSLGDASAALAQIAADDIVIPYDLYGRARGTGSAAGAIMRMPVAGTISEVAVTSTTVELSATAATKGVAGYTYQWYYGNSPLSEGAGLTFGTNSLSATATGLEPDTIYYFRLKVTDAVGNVAYSDNFSSTTEEGGGGGGLIPFALTPEYGFGYAGER